MVWFAIAVAILAALGGAYWFIRRRRAQEPLESVVMLRSARRSLTETDVRGAARRAIGPEVQVIAMQPPDETTNGFVVIVNDAPCLFVIDSGRVYGEDLEAESQRFENPQARAAYREHKAWLSVDVPNSVRRAAGDELRPLMARLAAELYDEGCTLLYAPSLGRIALPDPEVERQLREGDLSSLFGNYDVNLPVFNTEGQSNVERAIERARREWPKFIDVWTRHGPACHGIVKGAFAHEGGHEHMWIEVATLSDGRVTGTLINNPVHVDLRKGQTVSVNAPNEISDWACKDGDEVHGMFVEKILRGG
jgi:uncharacterized protein YegJ (DUF2314 family)